MSTYERPDRALSKAFPQARTEEIVIQETDEELLIYDLESDRAICLNQTAAAVWKSCNGKNDLKQIIENAERTLKGPMSKEMVVFALDQLKSEGLISNADKIPNGYEGLSRREVMRKIGFGSMVALPLVASIVAPTALSAQSAPVGFVCTGICVPPGTDVCSVPGVPSPFSFVRTTSSDGSCTGMIDGAGGSSCPGPVTAGLDLCIT